MSPVLNSYFGSHLPTHEECWSIVVFERSPLATSRQDLHLNMSVLEERMKCKRKSRFGRSLSKGRICAEHNMRRFFQSGLSNVCERYGKSDNYGRITICPAAQAE